ncbi:hypothetical protein HGQ17_00160 [Nesterenkonia sp. MY13]|uniref:Uncharacterized protein n=1 Tax=Nesterenkonia sedimenti TaxID=1463632 RepID=A0A7X8TGT2_9MICC|nr:hypothetical protein [Nesterenkonia sedimenti]NLS08444.1 hypothetical protein [Nesterenkonia sedimenti]
MIHKPIKSLAEALGNNDFLPMGQKLALGKMLAAGAKEYVQDPEALDEVTVTSFAQQHGVSSAAAYCHRGPAASGAGLR